MNHDAISRQTNNLGDLLNHLLQHHHPYTRTALNELSPLMEQVVRTHGGRYPELEQLAALFRQLRSDMEMHLRKEENVLFPYLQKLADASVTQPPPFGTVANPVRVMMAEHETERTLLQRMMEVTHDFALPADACPSYSALYLGLHALIEDIHQHMDLENNRLFPLAIELEREQLAQA